MSKRPRHFSGLKLVAMLRCIDKDDFLGERKTEKGDMLDWEICSSDKISDSEEIEQFDDKNPKFM